LGGLHEGEHQVQNGAAHSEAAEGSGREGVVKLKQPLITRFKQVTGLPPCTFLLSCRIRTARKWLVETAKPITLIAQELGFSSSQHFAMQFKREFGITPSALRKGQQPMIRGGGQASDPLG
jgi:hypothetical protein